MGLQQLDLFGSYEEKPTPKVTETVVAEPELLSTVITEEQVIEPINEIVLPATEPAEEVSTIIFEPVDEHVAIEEPASESFVFVDDKIKVKIKPKAVVIAQQAPATIVKIQKKRGRKSYREIDAELDLIEVPDDNMLEQKMYYSITEVAKWFKVNASVLRYWENEFDILKPRKNRKGDRLFRPEDIRNLRVIYYLLRNRKFSIEGAKKYLRNNRKQVDNNLQVIESLTKFRSFLMELKANLGA